MNGKRSVWLISAFAAFTCLLLPIIASSQVDKTSTVRSQKTGLVIHPVSSSTSLISVDIAPSHALNKFSPNQMFGGSVDAIGIGGLNTLFSQSNVAKMLGSGIGNLTYRLYTELNVQDWHWNPTGTWSDATNNQGYFTGSAVLGTKITDSYGYLLPHRGSTHDQGDQLDWSRITDGDSTTYWKSNPYLSTAYTKEADALHPQWVLLNLGAAKSINAVRISWANPYAITYIVQYWTGSDAINNPSNGQWSNFATGLVTSGSGGTVTLKLSTTNTSARYVRILMTQSSGTYDSHGISDARNKMGFAIYEIGVGTVDSNGTFTDLVSHVKSQKQTEVKVSSTDPWHTSTSKNTSTEQVGLDFIYSNSLSQNLPMMVPVPMAYSTPENAVAEVAYLVTRGYPITGIELGEEPDGQLMSPEDYGAFYIQWANAIHAVYPTQKLGGPVLSGSVTLTWADAAGEKDWLKRFISYLNSHAALPSLSFVTTEHYPNYLVKADYKLLQKEPGNVKALFDEFTDALVPKGTAVYVTEYNIDSSPSVAAVDLLGALWQAVFVGEFVNRGGQGTYFYQNFPYPLLPSGSEWGLLGMFTADANAQASSTTSQYFSNLMISQLWCATGSGLHTAFPVTSNIKDSSGNTIVFPYALQRSDRLYSLLIVNADTADHGVSVSFTDTTSHVFKDIVTQTWLSPANYAWNPNGKSGYAMPSGPLNMMPLHGGTTTYNLPARSVTVLSGRIL